MAYNNTYGVQFISEDVYQDAVNNYTKTEGCRDQIQLCRELALASDPDTGSNTTVNGACAAALDYCYRSVEGAFETYADVSIFSNLGILDYEKLTTCSAAFSISLRSSLTRSLTPTQPGSSTSDGYKKLSVHRST